MNTREQQDKEYRAQWIRDAARDILMARFASEDPFQRPSIAPVDDGRAPHETSYSLALWIWEKYEQERK